MPANQPRRTGLTGLLGQWSRSRASAAAGRESATGRRRRILILHNARVSSNYLLHVACFPRYRPENVYVFHNIRAPVTESLRNAHFDAVIVNYDFLSLRTGRHFQVFKEKFAFAAATADARVALPMDDTTGSGYLDEWLSDLQIQYVYSPKARHLDVLYPRTHRQAQFRRMLNGYVDTATLAEVRQSARPFRDRDIDLGNRIKKLPPQFGRWGQTKGWMNERFAELAREAGLTVDVSTRPEDRFTGNDWLKFLGNCRFTVSPMGGTSLNDPYGQIKKSVNAYLAAHPDASFDEIEAACFPGLDQQYRFEGIGPRFVQAAVMGTVLIMPPEEYPGDLEPYVHYLPLREDLSNADEILALMQDRDRCARIADRAYDRLVASGEFSYERFVDRVFEDIDAELSRQPRATTKDGEAADRAIDAHLGELGRFMAGRNRLDAVTLATLRRVVYSIDRHGVMEETAAHLRRLKDSPPALVPLLIRQLDIPGRGISTVVWRALNAILGHPDPNARAIMIDMIDRLAAGEYTPEHFTEWEFCCAFKDGRLYVPDGVDAAAFEWA